MVKNWVSARENAVYELSPFDPNQTNRTQISYTFEVYTRMSTYVNNEFEYVLFVDFHYSDFCAHINIILQIGWDICLVSHSYIPKVKALVGRNA